MKSYQLSELTRTEVESLKARPRIDFSSIFNLVSLLEESPLCRQKKSIIFHFNVFR